MPEWLRDLWRRLHEWWTRPRDPKPPLVHEPSGTAGYPATETDLPAPDEIDLED